MIIHPVAVVVVEHHYLLLAVVLMEVTPMPVALVVAGLLLVAVQEEVAAEDRAAGHQPEDPHHPDHSGVGGECHEMDQISGIPVLVEEVAVEAAGRDQEAVVGEEVVRMVVQTGVLRPGDSHRHRHGTCLIVWHHWVMRSLVQFKNRFPAMGKSMGTMRMSQTPAKCTMSASQNRSSITLSSATRAPSSISRTRPVSKNPLANAHPAVGDNDVHQLLNE